MNMQPQNLNHDEIVQRIQDLHGEYDPDSNLTALDQLEICESIAAVIPEYKSSSIPLNQMENVNDVKWNDNGTCKRQVYFELSDIKKKVISDLKLCNHRTDRYTIALLLGELFPSPDTKVDHWLYIAQQWNPRAINRVINQMVKTQNLGIRSIVNPAAYFTKALQYRKKRRGVARF